MAIPAERSDLDLVRRQRDEAVAHARALEHQLGALRGEVKRLETALWRRTMRRRRLAALRARLRASIGR